MESQFDAVGFRPPQQARSREALRKLLTAAEEVLTEVGYEETTMAAVAERAGVSVGSIYRRFEGRDQLLAVLKERMFSDLEARIVAAVEAAPQSLEGVVRVYVRALADAFSHSAVLPDLFGRRDRRALSDPGQAALEAGYDFFATVTTPYWSEIERTDVSQTVRAAAETIMASFVHRAMRAQGAHGEFSDEDWSQYADRLAEMVLAFFRTPDGLGAR
ncbi:helix-turn-helix domain-containing protein [Aeromicrobium alkaliterrae]|uniref:HTH tetR-type domain-containing protein n=1 Tax=Aeromicrobium alkaliterrae TaxID=302168 RepID=A0ABN2JX36_9ACTN